MSFERVKQWWTQRPLHADALLAAGLAALAVLGLFVDRTDTSKDPDVIAVALTLAATLALCWRRRQPIAALAIGVVAVAMRQVFEYPETADSLAVVIAAYSVGAHVANRRVVRATAGVMLSLLATWNVLHAVVERSVRPLGYILGNGIIFGTAFLLGDNVRGRRVRLEALEERTRQLERERELRAAHAVAEERTRIARDLHDVLAHSLGVIAVQAGAARRVALTRPDAARDAMAAIEATARESLDELRSLLGVLRTGPPDEFDRRPQPGIADLDTFVAANGDVPVTLHVEGDVRPVSAMLDTAAYRIVQEALTNVRKHAGRAEATVTVRYAHDAVRVSIIDNGRGAAAQASEGGLGIVGMRERTAMCHGHLHAGPRPGGGWHVLATLPTSPAPTVEVSP